MDALSARIDPDRHPDIALADSARVASVAPYPSHSPNVAKRPVPRRARSGQPFYAALDLGTNNCRLLVATPAAQGFRVVDAFSRIVRLGEGLGASGRLQDSAMQRTIEALKVCRDKMEIRRVERLRLVATQACRIAVNAAEFVERAKEETGLSLEIVDQRTEAHLAAAGCASLADPSAQGVVLFDIGGGSSEIVWLDAFDSRRKPDIASRIRSWASLPIGVVTLAEQYGGLEVSREIFGLMVDQVVEALAGFKDKVAGTQRCPRFHLLGTSGTVTTLAGIHLNLPRYDRRRVDGLWMSAPEISSIIGRLLGMPYSARAANPCVGPDRADLVLAGCAILEAIRLSFPSSRLRIADRGLREGILMQLMSEDGVWRRGDRSQFVPQGRERGH